MKPRRLGDWKRIADRAHRALVDGEWWDGKRWRSNDELPGTADEGRGYRAAHDVLGEALAVMVGYEPNSDEAVRAAARFARRAEADHEWTPAEFEAHKIFKLAQPLLLRKPFRNRPGFSDEKARRTAWTALAAHVSGIYGKPVTANRLRMICRQRGGK